MNNLPKTFGYYGLQAAKESKLVWIGMGSNLN